jgi:protein arginine N-methyltransferase 1
MAFELHCKLLGDKLRNQALYEALKKVIKPGVTTVSDIGSGTGFLSFLAWQLGAKQVYAYEGEPELVEMSRKLAARNKISGITWIPKYSFMVKKPVKTDVVVSETLGNFLLEEHILETLQDARRFLKSGGIMIPQTARQFVAPVSSERLWKKLNIWDSVGFDLKLDEGKQACLMNMFVEEIRQDELASGAKPVCWDNIDFTRREKSVRKGEALWQVQEAMTIYGFALWWEAEVVGEGSLGSLGSLRMLGECNPSFNTTISTSPFAAKTHWQQIFIPLIAPLSVEAGQSLELDLSSDTRLNVGVRLQWSAVVKNQQGKTVASCAMDTHRGLA